jgi:hypothetical protein
MRFLQKYYLKIGARFVLTYDPCFPAWWWEDIEPPLGSRCVSMVLLCCPDSLISSDRFAFVFHLGGPLSAGVLMDGSSRPMWIGLYQGSPFRRRLTPISKRSSRAPFVRDPADPVALHWCSGAGSDTPRLRCMWWSSRNASAPETHILKPCL